MDNLNNHKSTSELPEVVPTKSTKNIDRNGVDCPPIIESMLIDDGLPKPWNNKAERAFKDYYIRN